MCIRDRGQVYILDSDAPHSIGCLGENDILISLLISKPFFTEAFFHHFTGGSVAVSYTHLDVYKRQGLLRSMPDATKIIIAQRITSVLHADQIVILQDGRINAVGTHESLLSSNPIYQEIYQSQQEGADL